MYHAGGIRPVPGWLMAVANCYTDKRISAVSGQQDIKFNEDVNGQEGGADNTQIPNDGNHRIERQTQDARRESRIVVPEDLALESIKMIGNALRGDVMPFALFHYSFFMWYSPLLWSPCCWKIGNQLHSEMGEQPWHPNYPQLACGLEATSFTLQIMHSVVNSHNIDIYIYRLSVQTVHSDKSSSEDCIYEKWKCKVLNSTQVIR